MRSEMKPGDIAFYEHHQNVHEYFIPVDSDKKLTELPFVEIRFQQENGERTVLEGLTQTGEQLVQMIAEKIYTDRSLRVEWGMVRGGSIELRKAYDADFTEIESEVLKQAFETTLDEREIKFVPPITTVRTRELAGLSR